MLVTDIAYAFKFGPISRIVWSIRSKLGVIFAETRDIRRNFAYDEIVDVLAHAGRNDCRYAVRIHLNSGVPVEGIVCLEPLLDAQHHRVGCVTLRSRGYGEVSGLYDYHYVSIVDVSCVTLISIPREDCDDGQ